MLDEVDPALGVRRVRVPRFPYQVVYLQVGNDVHVIAIAHDSREPAYWRERLAT